MDNAKVLRAAGSVGIFVLFSRVFGFLRDMAMAAFFGSSPAMDAFVVAFTVPNLFRALFGEGALSASFVPVFTETQAKQGEREMWRFATHLFSILSLVLAGVVAAGILLATLAQAVLPLNPRLELILDLLRIMLPYLFFICLTAYFSAMLNSLHRFVLPAATPVLLNLVMLAALWGVCPRLGAEGAGRITVVAWSVVLAGALQWGVQLPSLYRCGYRLRFAVNWRDSGVRRVVQLMGAAILGVGITQINVVLDRLIAVFIGEGAPSYLYYAERVLYLPLGLFATSLGTVLLPALSAYVAQGRRDQVLDTLNHALRNLMFIMLPAAVGLLVLAEPIVRLTFERGGFSAHTTAMTTLALRCYAPGLIVFSLLKVFIPVFYAHQNMLTPVRVGMLCTGVGLVLKLLLMWPLRHAGIALATVLSFGLDVAILAVLVHRRIGSPGWGLIALAVGRMALAAAVLGAVAFGVQTGLTHALADVAWPSVLRQALALGAAIGLGGAVYLALAAALRCPELGDLWAALGGRLRRRLHRP